MRRSLIILHRRLLRARDNKGFVQEHEPKAKRDWVQNLTPLDRAHKLAHLTGCSTF